MGSDSLQISPLTFKHCTESYLNWLSDPEVNEFLHVPRGPELNMTYLVSYVKNSLTSADRFCFAFTHIDSGEHIGNGSIYDINKNHSSFQIGWFIGNKSFWGGLTSSQIMFALFEHGFFQLQLSTNNGLVDSTHVRARMANKFIGYKELGTSHYQHPTLGKRPATRLIMTREHWCRRRLYFLKNHFASFSSLCCT